jgi:Fic family protein
MARNSRTGNYITSTTAGEKYQAFVPAPLPFTPLLHLEELQGKLGEANLLLGKLDGITSRLPDIGLLLYFYVRKEALLSSQIEGTQSSFDDLLLYESHEVPSVPIDDVEEVSHYVAALQHGLTRMREGFPLSLRLIQEIHEILLRGGRGHNKQPGEFRRSQNWIGGTRPGNAAFVPPPPEKVMECMGNLELYLHDHFGKTPTLIKAAIAHVQFETIHPFLDGNGRVGRLLITLLLCAEGILREPVLFLSLYIKQHRPLYYELLNRVRTEGVWEVWLEYFLDAVIDTAKEAIASTTRIHDIFEQDKNRIKTLARASASALKVFDYLQHKAMCSIPTASKELELTQPTVTTALERLAKLGIVSEATGRQRDRMFVYDAYLGVLREGT